MIPINLSVLTSICVGSFLIYVVYLRQRNISSSKGNKQDYTKAEIHPIGNDFKWEEYGPRPYRPFAKKKNFQVSMGLINEVERPEDHLLIENTYLENTRLRKETTNKYPENTLFAYDNEITRIALCEFYNLVVKFLTKRYPQYFKIKSRFVENLINGEKFPVEAETVSSQELLLYLAANIEEDFLILIKDNPQNSDEEYILRASVTGFPAGFDPKENHNKPISFIHKPVPQYKNRLQLSMSKFFNRLESKDLWGRFNWSIQTHKSKFSLNNNHAYLGEKVVPLKTSEIDFENSCFLRVERQLFTRLPRLRAILMTVRTYLTLVSKVKGEGLAADLCFAIDSLPEDLAFYKRRGSWGEAVKEYLQQ